MLKDHTKTVRIHQSPLMNLQELEAQGEERETL